LEEVMAEREYLVILEPGENCWGAYSPDVPGCIATAPTREEVEIQFAEALAFHLEGLTLAGAALPEPLSVATRVRVA
jgi:predicted RNase H-like HicB family nuclease